MHNLVFFAGVRNFKKVFFTGKKKNIQLIKLVFTIVSTCRSALDNCDILFQYCPENFKIKNDKLTAAVLIEIYFNDYFY